MLIIIRCFSNVPRRVELQLFKIESRLRTKSTKYLERLDNGIILIYVCVLINKIVPKQIQQVHIEQYFFIIRFITPIRTVHYTDMIPKESSQREGLAACCNDSLTFQILSKLFHRNFPQTSSHNMVHFWNLIFLLSRFRVILYRNYSRIGHTSRNRT